MVYPEACDYVISIGSQEELIVALPVAVRDLAEPDGLRWAGVEVGEGSIESAVFQADRSHVVRLSGCRS